MQVRLTKLNSTHNNLRTDVIEGECIYLPRTGYSFVMTSEPLNPNASFRQIATSNVQSIFTLNDKSMEFKTMNSTYLLEVL